MFSNLNPQQVGTYAEYYVKMKMTKHGISVFSAEVDDRGIDFVARIDTNGRVRHFDVQVKSVRSKTSYIFIPETKFRKAENYIVAIVLFDEQGEKPNLYLIPATAWDPISELLTYKDYESRGLKSKNEYGINLSVKNMPLLEQFRFKDVLSKL